MVENKISYIFVILSLTQGVVCGQNKIQLQLFNVCIDYHVHTVAWTDQQKLSSAVSPLLNPCSRVVRGFAICTRATGFCIYHRMGPYKYYQL